MKTANSLATPVVFFAFVYLIAAAILSSHYLKEIDEYLTSLAPLIKQKSLKKISRLLSQSEFLICKSSCSDEEAYDRIENFSIYNDIDVLSNDETKLYKIFDCYRPLAVEKDLICCFSDLEKSESSCRCEKVTKVRAQNFRYRNIAFYQPAEKIMKECYRKKISILKPWAFIRFYHELIHDEKKTISILAECSISERRKTFYVDENERVLTAACRCIEKPLQKRK